MAPPARVDELKKRYEENPRRFFAPLANEYRKAGDLDAAIDLCRMHLEEQPGHLSGHIVYGQALFESARAAEAKTAFEAALTLDPENLIALRHLGDIAKADADTTAAKHWYGRVLEADPRNDEVIALIDALGQAAPTPTVLLAEQHELPPAPNYADQAAAARAVDPNAPTPAVSIAAVPPAPAAPEPRLSIGLMDLDLNLADSTTPTVDLLGLEPAAPEMDVLGMAPAAPAEAAMVIETPPAVHEPAPAIDGGFSLIDTESSVPEIEGSGMPGIEGISLGASVDAEPAVDVLDTSFDAPPVEDESMFAAPHVEPSFGDALDVIASAGVETTAEPAEDGPLGGLDLVNVGDTVPIGESVTEPKAAHAAPATPADFDALFGTAPIVDVQIGGNQTPASVEDAGFHADSFVGREPTDDVLAAAPDIATPPSPFVTETMAELYLQQGFRDEALSVYRQLLAQNPDDKGLAERVLHLEHGTRSSLAIDSISEEIEAAEQRKSGSIPMIPVEAETEATVSQPEPELVPVASEPAPEPVMEVLREPEPPTPESLAPLAEAVPAFLVEAPAAPVEPPAAPVEAPAAAVEPPAAPVEAPAASVELPPEPAVITPMPVAVGPLARDIFSRIASRRAVPGGGFAKAAAVESEAAAPAARETAPTAREAAPATTAAVQMAVVPEGEVTVAPGGSVDRLFDMSGVVAADEGAAIVMAIAFGAAPPVTPIRGEPTRKGTDELSLDSVFGSDGPARPSMVHRQSSTLRFDQFFSGAEGGESAAAAPPPSATPAGGDDIAQFSDWLKGLKGS